MQFTKKAVHSPAKGQANELPTVLTGPIYEDMTTTFKEEIELCINQVYEPVPKAKIELETNQAYESIHKEEIELNTNQAYGPVGQ